MQVVRITGFRTAFATTQWRRGLRAGLSVGATMVMCALLGHPMGWAALGGLQTVMVDNGGPYRTRMANALTVLIGGSAAVTLGTLAGVNLPTAMLITLLFCFAATIARVLSQPLASSSVVILVCYIVAYGSPLHTLASGASNATDFVLGGVWAALLTLVLWPVDPFRPARDAVADVYDTLKTFTSVLPDAQTTEGSRRFNALLSTLRIQIEAAQYTIASTPARMTARTIRARNLSVLNESADLLMARVLRLAELGQEDNETSSEASAAGQTSLTRSGLHEPPGNLTQIASWLSASLAPIAPALRQRPARGESAFEPYAKHLIELKRGLQHVQASLARHPAADPDKHLVTTLRESLLNLEIAYDAVCAIWTGTETRKRLPEQTLIADERRSSVSAGWNAAADGFDALRGNLNLNSVMFRHSLRLSLVVAVDVLLIHYIRITHGYWLAMTSIIVLQPYTGETVRRSGERVVGTVAGGILAAVFAASIHSHTGLIVGISLGATLAVALYTVDYAWYCFFLTPTIVLMTIPHLRDWHFAAVRMGMTGLGALVAVAAMLLLWPERESRQLPHLLARAAEAEAAYVRAMLAFWQSAASKPEARIAAERTLLAPARRLCGLATNDAEETLDHALLEHAIPLNPERTRTERLNQSALTFTTYLRRLTQTITALAATGTIANEALQEAALGFIERLNAVSAKLRQVEAADSNTGANAPESKAIQSESLSRMERQISVLESAAFDIASL